MTCYEPCSEGKILNFGFSVPSPKVSKQCYSIIQCSVFFYECLFRFLVLFLELSSYPLHCVTWPRCQVTYHWLNTNSNNTTSLPFIELKKDDIIQNTCTICMKQYNLNHNAISQNVTWLISDDCSHATICSFMTNQTIISPLNNQT